MPSLNDIVVLLEVGHNEDSKGAINEKYPRQLNEYEVNKEVARKLSVELYKECIFPIIIWNGSISQKINIINTSDYGKLTNKVDPILIQVSLHFNAYKGYTSNSSGSEVLISDKKPKSAFLAECLLKEFVNLTSMDRGIKVRTEGTRGYKILTETIPEYAVICEPLFIDSEEGEMLLDEATIDFLVESYKKGLINFITEGLKCKITEKSS